MASIYLRKYKAGGVEKTAYRVAFTVDGVDRRRQFKTKREAKAFAENLWKHREDIAKKMKDKSGANITVAQLGEIFLDACKVGRDGDRPLEPMTIKSYEGHMRTHINPLLGDRIARTVTKLDVREFRDELIRQGKGRAIIKKVLTTLGSVFRYGFLVEKVPNNPTTGVRIQRDDSRVDSGVSIHEKKDMAHIIAKAVELSLSDDKRRSKSWTYNSLFLMVLVYGGLRFSEVRGLPRNAIHPTDGTIRVFQRADRSGIIGPPKTRRSFRKVFLPIAVIERLHEFIKGHPHDLVFATRGGKAPSATNLTKRMWFEVQREAGVPRKNLHSCRHFFASRMIEDGANLKELSEALGHADEAFTIKTYGHLFQDADSMKKRRDRAERSVLGDVFQRNLDDGDA